MSKTKKRPMLDSDSDESNSDLEEESQTKKSKLNTTGSQSSTSGSSSDGERDDDWTVEGGKVLKKSKKHLGKRSSSQQSAKKSGIAKKLAKVNSESSDSEEETSRHSTQTGSLTSDSSSSDSSGSEDDSDTSSSSSDDIQYPDGLDGELVGDEEDRQKLASMTEAEREQELFKRHEQREVLMARLKIKKTIKRQQKMRKRKKKDHKHRQRTLRAKEPRQTKTTRAIDELKAVRTADRQKKAAEAERKRNEGSESGRKEPLKVSVVYSDSSSDDEDDAGERSLSGLRAESSQSISTSNELSKIKLSRFRLEKWVHMPFFEKIVKGCFVRIGIGQHEGRMVYRICEIVGVQETPKVYTLGNARTNKGLKLRFGQQERVFRMEYISNSPFADNEFVKWKEESESNGIPLPTSQSIKKKTQEIDETKNADLNEEDIEKIISEKQKFRKNPHNYALTKNRLIREKEIAEQLGDHDKASSISKQLDQLEERAEELDKQRTKGLSAISYINERNRQRNVERAEEALKEEMANIKEKEEDPFTRRKCMPRLVTFGKDGAGNPEMVELTSSQTQKNSESAITNTSGGSNGQDIEEQSGEDNISLNQTPNVSRLLSTPASLSSDSRNRVDDLFSAHDFDISIDLPTATQGPDLMKAVPKQVTTPKNDGPRRSLNLSDYKKRRGLI